MNKKYYIGIDPGSSNGGIVVLDNNGDVVSNIKCPDTDKDILLALEPYRGSYLCIEKLWGRGGMVGGTASIWTQAENYGMLKMAALATGMIIEEVVPNNWQKTYGVKREKEQSSKDWKNVLKDKAQKLFPTVNVTNWSADALLIALYCKNKNCK